MRLFIPIIFSIILSPILADESQVDMLRNIAVNWATVDKFVQDSAKPFKDKSPADIRKYGPIVGEETRMFKTPYGDDASDHTIQFKNVLLEGFYIPKKKRFFIKYLVISDPNYPVALKLRIGSSEKDIATAMKHEGERSDNTITYSGETEQAVFHIEKGRIKMIELSFYTG